MYDSQFSIGLLPYWKKSNNNAIFSIMNDLSLIFWDIPWKSVKAFNIANHFAMSVTLCKFDLAGLSLLTFQFPSVFWGRLWDLWSCSIFRFNSFPIPNALSWVECIQLPVPENQPLLHQEHDVFCLHVPVPEKQPLLKNQ